MYGYAKLFGSRPATAPRGESISRLARSGAEVEKREFKLSTSYNKADAHHKEYSPAWREHKSAGAKRSRGKETGI